MVNINTDYVDGMRVSIGDRVQLWAGMKGRVVCKFETAEFCEGFDPAEWPTIKKGFMILSETGEFFHYEQMDEDVELLSRAE